MADTTLNDIIGALREGNGNEQTQALLERVAASNASIVERLTRSEVETQRRYQEEKSARENAEKDAENARNEAALAAKNNKQKADGKGGIGGFLKDRKDSVSKMGGGEFGMGVAVGAMRLGGIGAGLAALGSLTLDPETIEGIGENAKKAKIILENTARDVSKFLETIELELPPLSVVAEEGGKKISNALDGIIALQEGDTKTFVKNASDAAQITAAAGKGLERIAKDGKGIIGATSKVAVAADNVVTKANKAVVATAAAPIKMLGNQTTKAIGATADAVVGQGDNSKRKATQAKILKGLTETQLNDLETNGFKVAKDGTLRNKGAFMNPTAVDDALRSIGATTSAQRVTRAVGSAADVVGSVTGKVPKSVTDNLSKIAKIPGLSQALAAVGVWGVMTDPNLTEEQRYNQTVKVLAGLGGATLGGFAGALLGSGAGPLGALGGGIAAGIYGGIAGEQLAEPIAQALLGLPIDLPAGVEKISGFTQKGSAAFGRAGRFVGDLFGGSDVENIPNQPNNLSLPIDKPANYTGQKISEGQMMFSGGGYMGSGPPMVVSDTSQKITNVGGPNAMVTGGLTSGDPIPSGTS